MSAAATLPRRDHDGEVTEFSRKFSGAVRKRRDDLGMGTGEFAMLMGISRNMVGALDRADRNWTAWMIERACHVLRVAPWVLMRPPAGWTCPDCGNEPEPNRMCGHCGAWGPLPGEGPQ
jgi:hypothetical protein